MGAYGARANVPAGVALELLGGPALAAVGSKQAGAGVVSMVVIEKGWGEGVLQNGQTGGGMDSR